MTIVHVVMAQPAADGVMVPATGVMRFTPTARRVIVGTPDTVVLPASFQVNLLDGVADVLLAPTDLAWVWRIDEHVSGTKARTIYAAVPDVAAVDYTDLVPIDPETLAPEPSPNPAWLAPFTDLETRLDAGTVTPDPDHPGFYLIGA
jgi:hypothetical protein